MHINIWSIYIKIMKLYIKGTKWTSLEFHVFVLLWVGLKEEEKGWCMMDGRSTFMIIGYYKILACISDNVFLSASPFLKVIK